MARALAVLTLLVAPAAAYAVETMRIHMGDVSGEVLVSADGLGFSSDVEDAALKAQAVAARTYALHKKLEAYDEPYHLGSSVLHQVYGGLRREDERTRAAVEATRGEVLTWELQPIEAYFHAACGGHTEEGLPALSRDLPYLT